MSKRMVKFMVVVDQNSVPDFLVSDAEQKFTSSRTRINSLVEAW